MTSARVLWSAVACGLALGLSSAAGQAMKKDDTKKAEPPMMAAPPPPSAFTLVTGVFPSGAKLGSTVSVRVEGRGLIGATQLWFGHPKITAKLAEPATETTAVYAVTVPADVPVGIVAMRLLTPQGASDLRGFAVGAEDELIETEPDNDSPEKAPTVTAETVANGRLTKYDDIDCYRVAGRVGARFLVAADCRSLGGRAELALAVSDFRGKLVATAAKPITDNADPLLDFTFPETGEYVVRVWSLSVGDDAGRIYRLRFTARPVIEFADPAGLTRGSSATVRLGVRDPSGKLGKRHPAAPYTMIAVPATASADPLADRVAVGLGVPDFANLAGAALLLSDLPEITEPTDKPADDVQRALPVSLPIVVNGRLDGKGRRGHFAVAAKKGQLLRAEVAAAKIGSPGDLALAVLDARGNQLAANDDGDDGDTDPRLDFAAPADGTYIFRVGETVPERITGPRHTYRLTLRELTADFALSTGLSTVLAAAEGPGAEVVVPIQVDRLGDFAGPVKLIVTGLPAEVRVDAPPIPAGASGGFVRLTVPKTGLGRGANFAIVGEAELAGKTARRVVAVPAASGGPTRGNQLFLGIGRVLPLTLETKPDALDAKPGATAKLTVKVARHAQVIGPVELLVAAGPAGTVGAKVVIDANKDTGELTLKFAAKPPPAEADSLVVLATVKLGELPLAVAAAPLAVRGPTAAPTVAKTEPKAEPKTVPKTEPKAEPKTGPKTEPKVEPKTEPPTLGKPELLIAAGAAGWRFVPAADVKGEDWLKPDFKDAAWKTGKAPLGYGEDVISARKGTLLDIKGQDILFRLEFTVDAKLLAAAGELKLLVCADDSAEIWINGQLADRDDKEHEFAYWNRQVVVPTKLLVAGRNVMAVRLRNGAGSSDAVLDVQLELHPKGK